jgi:hypothetical protein
LEAAACGAGRCTLPIDGCGNGSTRTNRPQCGHTGDPDMKNIQPRSRKSLLAVLAVAAAVATACTQEKQNQIQRSIQNWTGTNGVLEIYAGDKLVRRFMKIDKLSTAYGTDESAARPYRFGYGVLDENLNFQIDSGEKRVYFEISDYSTHYVFFENPR